MYYKFSVKDTFAMPPEHFGDDIEKVAAEVLQKKYEGTIDKEMGIIIAVFNFRNISDGSIFPGDPSTHHNIDFDVLSFVPTIEEIVNGEVAELMEFGAFVRIGPIEGLVHVSQITNDYLTFNKKIPAFVSKQSGKTLKKGDSVLAKISTVSMKEKIKDSKIALTMRPEGLGKAEWEGMVEQVAKRGGPRSQQRSRQRKK